MTTKNNFLLVIFCIFLFVTGVYSDGGDAFTKPFLKSEAVRYESGAQSQTPLLLPELWSHIVSYLDCRLQTLANIKSLSETNKGLYSFLRPVLTNIKDQYQAALRLYIKQGTYGLPICDNPSGESHYLCEPHYTSDGMGACFFTTKGFQKRKLVRIVPELSAIGTFANIEKSSGDFIVLPPEAALSWSKKGICSTSYHKVMTILPQDGQEGKEFAIETYEKKQYYVSKKSRFFNKKFKEIQKETTIHDKEGHLLLHFDDKYAKFCNLKDLTIDFLAILNNGMFLSFPKNLFNEDSFYKATVIAKVGGNAKLYGKFLEEWAEGRTEKDCIKSMAIAERFFVDLDETTNRYINTEEVYKSFKDLFSSPKNNGSDMQMVVCNPGD